MLKFYYGLRWLLWNAAHFVLAVYWLFYQSSYAGNALRFLMAFSIIGQVISLLAFDLVSDGDRRKATKHLVFSEPVYGGWNYTADLLLAILLATFGQFRWAAVGVVSLILTGAILEKSYKFLGTSTEVKPEPRECGCQHCN